MAGDVVDGNDWTSIERDTRRRLAGRLRVGLFLVVMCSLFLLSLPNIVRAWSLYDPPWTQLCAFAVLVAVLVVEAGLLIRGRPWPAAARIPAVVAVVVAVVVSHEGLPHSEIATANDWIFGAANWIGIVVLFESSFRTQCAFLGLHWLIELVMLLDPPQLGIGTTLRFLTGSVGVLGYPLCVALTSVALNSISRSAASAKYELEQSRIVAAATDEFRRQRRERFADVDDTVIPLLEGLKTGVLDPQDGKVRRASAIAAARLRRRSPRWTQWRISYCTSCDTASTSPTAEEFWLTWTRADVGQCCRSPAPGDHGGADDGAGHGRELGPGDRGMRAHVRFDQRRRRLSRHRNSPNGVS